MDIWTDGTMSPERALSTSAKILIDHLRFVAGVNEETLTVPVEREVSGSRLSSEMAETPVEALDLSVRVFNSLKRTGITTVGDVLDLLEKGETAVMSIRNFGEKSLDELRQKMREKGFMKDETSSAE
jgi:DNA-directed RNA polymerase subunit alpha